MNEKRAAIAPPVAARAHHVVESPNGARVDEYYWLRDDTRTDEKVLAYLRAENEFTSRATADLKPLENALFVEITRRTKPDDSTVPVRRADYWYYAHFEGSAEYPYFARKKRSLAGVEEILIDGPSRAKGHAFFQIGMTSPSPDARYVAFTEDTIGRRQFTLRIFDTKTRALLGDEVPGMQAGIAWLNDNNAILYVENDPVTLLGSRVKKHVLGTSPHEDVLVYEESDKSFYLTIYRAKSGQHVLLSIKSTLVTEVRFADANASTPVFTAILPREPNHEYSADVLDANNVFLLTNDHAKNFRIVRTKLTSSDRSTWRDVVAHDDAVFVEDFDVFRDVIAVNARIDGRLRVFVVSLENTANRELIEGDEKDFTMMLVSVPEPDDPIRYVYTSLGTPRTVFDYDAKTKARTLMKRDEVCGQKYDPNDYVTDLIWAPARDGKKIPVSIFAKKSTEKNGTAPLFQYGYGAYGISIDPTFDSALLSLVDRGFVYAIAHVRGGQELGRAWYEDGKLLAKKNTFTDFIDVTDHLVAEKWCDGARVFAEGRSAGGILMGVIANVSPEKYRGILAHVPFVDVVTTMLDESIPLTTNEYDEWGNPIEKQFYEYMLSYSPYDNVAKKRYPAMLVTAGLWDSQLQYYEPAKWVAKLRATETQDSGPLYLKTDMESGHGGKSGRYERFHDRALGFAFMLREAGISR